MQRVLVVGMSGAGKSTAARRLGLRTGLPYHEMDALAIGPDWSTPADLADTVGRILLESAWVFDSWGYPAVRDAMWAAADTVVWLDYPRRVVLPRLARRSVRRTLTRQRLFGGNRETARGWLRADHPLWFAIRTFTARRRYLGERTAGSPHLRTVRLSRPRDWDRWLAGCPVGTERPRSGPDRRR